MDQAKFWLTPKNQVNDVTGSSLPNNQLVFDLFWCKPPSRPRSKFLTRPRSIPPSPPRCKPLSDPQSRPRSAPRVLREEFYTFKCDSCFKWRLIPTKDKYEEILEYMGQHYFVCENACEWRPNISCDDTEDISLDEDDSWIWAFDKLGTPKTPGGWRRLVTIRDERSSQFADVYYFAPSGKRLRSKPTLKKFLEDHPEYLTNGVDLSRFSFTKPKPFQEYYRKKRSRAKSVGPKQDRPVSRPAKKRATSRLIQKDAVSPVGSPAKKQATSSLIQKDAVSPVGSPAKKRATSRLIQKDAVSPVGSPAKKQATSSLIQKDAASPVGSPEKKRATSSLIQKDAVSPVGSPAKKQTATSFTDEDEDEETPARYDLWTWI